MRPVALGNTALDADVRDLSGCGSPASHDRGLFRDHAVVVFGNIGYFTQFSHSYTSPCRRPMRKSLTALEPLSIRTTS